MQSKNLPPIPPPPPDYRRLGKIAITLASTVLLLFFGLSMGKRKHDESTYQSIYERLNTLLTNEQYEQCIADNSRVPSKYEGIVEGIKDRCRSLLLAQLVEDATKEPSSVGRGYDYWKEIMAKIDSYSHNEQEKASLKSRIIDHIKSLFDQLLLDGDISQVLKLLRLIGDNDQAAKLAQSWELDKQRFENSRQTITDVNPRTHDPFANAFTSEYEFPYWQNRFKAMINEIESKRRTRLLTQAQEYAEKRDWLRCMQLADQVRRENTDYKSTIQLEVNRKANELLKTCFYAKDSQDQQERE